MSPELPPTTSAPAPLDLAAPPVTGAEVVVTVQDTDGVGLPGQTVSVTHRPGLDGAREVAIGITDGLGRVRWTPEVDGVATVRTEDATLWVHVAPDPWPADTVALGVVVAVAAVAAIAFGLVAPRRWRPRSAR